MSQCPSSDPLARLYGMTSLPGRSIKERLRALADGIYHIGCRHRPDSTKYDGRMTIDADVAIGGGVGRCDLASAPAELSGIIPIGRGNAGLTSIRLGIITAEAIPVGVLPTTSPPDPNSRPRFHLPGFRFPKAVRCFRCFDPFPFSMRWGDYHSPQTNHQAHLVRFVSHIWAHMGGPIRMRYLYVSKQHSYGVNHRKFGRNEEKLYRCRPRKITLLVDRRGIIPSSRACVADTTIKISALWGILAPSINCPYRLRW